MSPKLASRLSMYVLLWRAATSQPSQRPSRVVVWGGLFLVCILCAAVGYSSGPRAALVFAWCAACAALLATWTWRFVPGPAALNAPANAKLVPQMRRRLVELSCGVWWTGIAGIAIAPLADPGSLGLWLSVVAVITVGCAFAAAGHQAGTPILAAAGIGTALIGRVPPAAHAVLSSPPVLALALLLYAGLIVATSRAMFPQGGEGHWSMIARRARVGKGAARPDLLVESLSGEHTYRWCAASLRSASARRDSRRLVLHVLGPAHHLGESMVGLGILSAVLVVLAVFTAWRTDGNVVRDIGWLFACLLLLVPVAQNLRLNGLMGAHPAEQALVRLAPAMPGTAPSFNRHLRRALLLQALKAWAAASSAALALTAVGGASAATLLNLACACCLILPLVAAPMRNHARRAPLLAWVAVTLLVVSAGMDLLLGFSARHAGLPVLPVAAALSVATAAFAVRRGLRVMENSPFAFPAGRID